MLKDDDRVQPSPPGSPLFPLAGAALLVVLALAGLPWKEGLFRRPRTLFDRSAARAVAPGYALLMEAAPRIPPGALVFVRTEPRDPEAETHYHRFADALLPGRRAIPAAFYGKLPPELSRVAQYILVVGPRPSEPPGELVLEIPDGTLWRVSPGSP